VVPQEWGAVVVASSGEDDGGTYNGEVFFYDFLSLITSFSCFFLFFFLFFFFFLFSFSLPSPTYWFKTTFFLIQKLYFSYFSFQLVDVNPLDIKIQKPTLKSTFLKKAKFKL